MSVLKDILEVRKNGLPNEGADKVVSGKLVQETVLVLILLRHAAARSQIAPYG